MQSLIPTEQWDYGFRDLTSGLFATRSFPAPIEDRYISIPGVGRCLPVRSARAAIVLALKALSLPPGASIAVPLYCCPVVFEAIKSSGCTARFIDVDADTLCMSAADLAAKSSKVDAVLAVHMFGNVCDIPALRRAAPGKPMIEDCAQALGSRLGDRSAGSFGEISVFSFRSGKYVSAGEGGAIYSSQTDINSRLLAAIRGLDSPTRVEEWLHVVKTYLRSALRRRPLWGIIGERLWRAHGEKVSDAVPVPVVPARMYETDFQTTLRRLPLQPAHLEKHRSIADYYKRNFTVESEMLSMERAGAYFSRLQYPLRFATALQCEQFVDRLRMDHISTSRPQKDIALVASKHYGYQGDCPRAEQIAETIVVIPCNYALKISHVERIARCVNRAWTEINGSRTEADSQSISGSEAAARRAENLKQIAENGQFL